MNEMKDLTIGAVGLGQMGLPVCGRLSTVAPVLPYDISPERRALAEEISGVRATGQLNELKGCRRIVLSLPSPSVSRTVMSELAPLLPAGALIVETSTVLPDDVRTLQTILAGSGARVIDAAILSGVAQMNEGRASLLIGGEGTDIAAAKSMLDAIGPGGQQTFGGLGAGMAAKVVNNGVAHAVMVLLTEAFVMARAEDIPLAAVANMLSRADGGLMRPLTHRIQERVASGAFDEGMPLDAARKDSTLALGLAQSNSIPTFVMQAAHTVYEIAMAEDLARRDYAALATLWENWTGMSLQFGTDA